MNRREQIAVSTFAALCTNNYANKPPALLAKKAVLYADILVAEILTQRPMIQEVLNLDEFEPMSVYELERHYNIHKVPQVVYQMVYDMAAADGYSEESKWKVLAAIEDWAEERFPGYTVGASAEFSNKDIEQLSKKISNITFGIYVKLKPRVDTISLPTTDRKLLK